MDGLIQNIIIWVSILFFWVYFYGPHQKYWQDRTRHDLFAIRDELFIKIGQSNGIDYAHPSYKFTRMKINSTIRHIETLTLTRLFLVIYYVKKNKDALDEINREESEMRSLLSSLDREDKKLLIKATRDLHLQMTMHLIRTSIMLCPLFLVAIKLTRALKQINSVKRIITKKKALTKYWVKLDHSLYQDDPELDNLTA